MDHISSKINQKISFLKGTNQNELLKVRLQSKLEYLLFLTLGYLWNKNWNSLDIDSKEYCIENILKPSIGSVVTIIRKLDIDKAIFGNKKEKDLQKAIDKYPNLRNEKIGHGYSFEDDTEKLLEAFENIIDAIEGSELFLYNQKNDIILVTHEMNGIFSGISFKSDGFGYSPWKCPSSIAKFDIDSTYLFTWDNNYFKLSPFVEIESEGEGYVFGDIQEKLTGRIKYNQLLKTGVALRDKSEISSLLISSEKHKKKTANGTIINNFERNYKKFIHNDTKAKIREFLLKNQSSVFATIWGHGGVGKTASIQSLCEDLSNEQKKSFDYIVFISAKNRFYDYYKGSILELENNLSSFDSVVKYINKILFNNEVFEKKSILEFEGSLLLIIDDFETFSKQENENIIQFIKTLNINHHKVILTTRSATFITGEEIKTNELSEPETQKFLLEAAKIELPDYNTEVLKKELQRNSNLQKVHEITSGRPLFIFQFAILLGQKGSIEETLNFDIKSTKAAINFLYDRIYDYLSLDAKNMFVAISLLVTEDDLSNLLDKLKFILNKENKEGEFQIALNELIKLKIIELVDKDFFRVYSAEILRLMRKYYENKGPEYEGNITNRFQLIDGTKTINTDWALLENADSSRIISTEEEVENKYRYILNRDKTPLEIKLKAAVNYTAYLVSHKSKIEKAIKVYDDYYHIFYKTKDYIKNYAQYCWAEGSIESRYKAVKILKDFLATRTKVTTEEFLDLLGILMTYSAILFIGEREEIKERLRYKEIDPKEYESMYKNQKERFSEAFRFPGQKLYSSIKEYDILNAEPYVRHSALEGLSHFVEICIRNQKLKLAKEVCTYVLENLPQNFRKPFIFKLSKIDALENPNRIIDPYKKTETAFGKLLKEKLLGTKKAESK